MNKFLENLAGKVGTKTEGVAGRVWPMHVPPTEKLTIWRRLPMCFYIYIFCHHIVNFHIGHTLPGPTLNEEMPQRYLRTTQLST